MVLVGRNPTWRLHVKTIERAAAVLNVHLTITHVDNPKSIEPSIEAFAGKPNSGMIALPDIMLDTLLQSMEAGARCAAGC